MKKIITVVSIVVTALVLAILIPFAILGIRTESLNTDYSYLKNDEEYSVKVEVEGMELVTQHISCGYACIEMLSTYYGNKVSEDELDAKNKGGVSTSSSSSVFLLYGLLGLRLFLAHVPDK